MATIVIDDAELRELRRRAELLVRGELQELGQPVGGPPALEELRRAIDLLGAHTKQSLNEQHAYIAALSSAQEAERGRLARELHDEVVQQLIALGHGVDRVQRMLKRGAHAQATERLQTMRGSITGLVAELRTVIGDLRPPALEELGLLPAVELLLQRVGEGAPAVDLLVEGRERRLAPQSELALFRIIQEAWSNIRRHARAARAEVRFAYTPQALIVTVADNGVGMEPFEPGAAPAGHWGLRGMRERAELMGGTLTITSQAGQGARLVVAIPYPGVDGRDPVCGMSVGPDDPGAEHAGQLYRFCSAACRELFLTRPEQYIVTLEQPQPAQPQRVADHED